MPSFLGGKSCGAFGQPAFFLAGNRMTIVAFEKEVSLTSLSLFSKTIVQRAKESPEIYFRAKSFRTIFEKRPPVYSLEAPLLGMAKSIY